MANALYTEEELQIVDELVNFAHVNCPFEQGTELWHHFQSYLENMEEADSIRIYADPYYTGEIILAAATEYARGC